jgi:hypothetical protein
VGAGETRRLSVPATDEGIGAALDALGALWDEAGVSPALTWPVEVSLDEVLANVVRHGLRGTRRFASCGSRTTGPSSIPLRRRRPTRRSASTSGRSAGSGSSS